MAEKIGDLSWVEDGAGREELSAVFGLIRLADEGHLAKLIEEPWVVQGRNYPALQSLGILATSPETLDRIMSHPTIMDGITDQEAKIIATLHAVNADLLGKLLDPERVTLDERTITLPLGGETELTIIRTGPGSNHAINSLTSSVRKIEAFMGLPFPRRQVIYLVDESLDVLGRNYNTHVSIRTEYETQIGESTLELVAHEAGHYYWRGYNPLVSEGAAHILASVANDTLQGPLISLTCPCARSIAEFEEWQLVESFDEPVHGCHYTFGERLFRDLYNNFGDTAFRLAFRRLYLYSGFNIPNDECGDSVTSVCHVKEAFTTYTAEEKVPVVERVIARWYDFPETYDISHIEDTPVNPDIPAIDGRVEEAYLSLTWGGSPVSNVYVGPNRNPLVLLNLDYSFENSSRLEFLPIYTELYLDDGTGIQRMLTDLQVLPLTHGTKRWSHAVNVPFWREVGRFWVQAYSGEQKIAEVTFETAPDPGPLAIRGTISDPDGRPAEGIVLEAVQGEERFRGRPESDGTFEIVASSGEFPLEVDVLVGSEYVFAGWYDGKGSITKDPNKAFTIIVVDGDVEDIDIILPAVSDANFRGVVTGPDGQPLARIELEAKGAEDGFRVNTAPDGTFDLVVQPGSYILKVSAEAGSHYVSLGWYDGSGGITTDPSQAFEVIVDGTNVQDIAIMLPFVFDTNIRGFVTGPDGRPIEGIGLTVKGRGVRLWAETKPGGSFHIVATSGSFVIQVLVPVRTPDGTNFQFVGWYDGGGGITTDRSKAFEVIVDDADVEGINIMLPKDPEDLL